MRESKNTLILVSGGPDSATLVHDENSKREIGAPPVNGLYIRTGYTARAQKEMDAAKHGYNNVLIGWQKYDTAHGTEFIREYISKVNGIIELARKMNHRLTNVEVRAPYASVTKIEIWKRAQELGLDLNQTWSCINDGQIHCGECDGCKARHYTFIETGIKDLTEYGTKPDLTDFDISNADNDDIWELRAQTI